MTVNTKKSKTNKINFFLQNLAEINMVHKEDLGVLKYQDEKNQ